MHEPYDRRVLAMLPAALAEFLEQESARLHLSRSAIIRQALSLRQAASRREQEIEALE